MEISHEDEFLIAAATHTEKPADSSNVYMYSKCTPRNLWNTGTILTTVIATTILTTLFSALLTVNARYSTSSPLPGTKFGSCGNTSTSARLANCTFDLMSFSWLPSSCTDPDLTAEFLAVRNWSWWLDANSTVSVSTETVQNGELKEVFVTREFHMYHCTYMWRKLHRGLLMAKNLKEGRGVVDTYIGEYRHTAHCEMMLVGMDGDRRVTDTAIELKFPKCMWT